MKYLSRLLPLFLVVTLFAACGKDDPQPTTPVNTDTGTLLMHLHTYIGNDEVDDYGIVYTTETGRRISLDMAQMYLSNFQLVRADGSMYDVPKVKILQELDKETYSLGDVPVGEYKAVIFHLGFNTNANKAAPSTDAALLDRPEMWFGNSAQPDGYVFLHASGKVDVTTDGSGQMLPFEYKIGTSSNYMLINLPDKKFTVVKDQASYVHLLADYSQIFDGIDITQPANRSVLTAAENSVMPATWVTQNIPLFFRYEE